MSVISSASGTEFGEPAARGAAITREAIDRNGADAGVGRDEAGISSATAVLLHDSDAIMHVGPLGAVPGTLPAVWLVDLLDPTPQCAKRKPAADEPEGEEEEEEDDDLPEDDAEEEEEEDEDFDDDEDEDDEDDEDEDDEDEDEEEEDDFDNPDDDDDYDDDEEEDFEEDE